MRGLWVSVVLVGLGVLAFVWWRTPSSRENPPPPNANGKFTVYSTFYPTTYFAERIGGDAITVVCPLPPDGDPIFWKPDRTVVERYQKADLIVLNGAGFEKWTSHVSLPPARVVDTTLPFVDEFLQYDATVKHSHGPKGAHAHEGIDGHTWLDPRLAKAQAQEIKSALVREIPEESAGLNQRFNALAQDLDALDARLRTLFDRTAPPLLASHPAYNYLARRYEWKLRSLDLDPNEMPNPTQIAEIQALLKEHPARVILWESAPRPEIADRLRETLALASVVFSPAEQLQPEDRQAGRDYLQIMQRNISALEAAIGK